MHIGQLLKWHVVVLVILSNTDPMLIIQIAQMLLLDFLSGGLLLSGLCMSGLNNYIVVQVVQLITYAILLRIYWIQTKCHNIIGLVARLIVLVNLVCSFLYLLSFNDFQNPNGEFRSFGYDEDLYLKSETWFDWFVTWNAQWYIWMKFLAFLRIVILIYRLILEINCRIIQFCILCASYIYISLVFNLYLISFISYVITIVLY